MAMPVIKRRAPRLQEDEHDGEDEEQRFAQRDHHVMHGGRHEHVGVVIDAPADALRERLGKVGHPVADGLVHVERVRTRQLKHRDKHGGLIVDIGAGRVLQRAEFQARHVLQEDGRLAGRAGAQNDFTELFGRAQPSERVDLHLERSAGRRRRGAKLAGRDLHVLLGDRLLHVDGGYPELGELVGIEPDAHRIAALTE